MSLVRRVHTVDERLQIPLHDRERRAQLVAHVGEKPPALLLSGLEPARHGVERACESACFTGASLAHSGREVAVGDAAHRLDHISERSGEPTKRSRRQQEAVQHHEQPHAARDIANRVGRSERRGERPEEDRRPDHREDRGRDEEHRHAPHEASPPPGRPGPATSRRERLVLRPPRRPPTRGVPPSAAHSSSSAKR